MDHDAEASAAWTTIRGRNGRAIRTNSFQHYAAGSRFVAVIDSNAQIGWWPAETWADPQQARRAMAAIWQAASNSTVVYADAYGPEYSFELTRGSVRADVEGTYVRMLQADGSELDGGSAYWCDDEWVEDPELVLGAICGAAAYLNQPVA